MTQTNLWFSFEKLPPEKKRVGHISGKWEMQKKWKYELIPCIPAIANKLTDSRWNLPPPQEMLMSSLHSNSNAGNHHDRYLHLYTFMGVFHQHFCFRSIIDIIDIDSWPNFIPLSKLCSGSTISAAESRCSCFFLTLAPKTCFWHTVGYGSILLRDMIYIYTDIHTYLYTQQWSGKPCKQRPKHRLYYTDVLDLSNNCVKWWDIATSQLGKGIRPP